MSGYKIAELPVLTDAAGRPVGMIGTDGKEVLFPVFSSDLTSLLKPDGTALAGQGAGYVLPAATAGALGGVKIGSGLAIDANGVITAAGGGGSYTLPQATSTVLGGVKIGANLSVDSNGLLNAAAGGGGSGSTRVVYLSSTCTSDTNLSPYAQVAGVDQRAKIQAVLDLAKTLGSLIVVWDVRVTLANVPGTTYAGNDADTLLISSNTTINALPGCGALQAAGSKGDMLKNANPTTNANNSASAIVDENITITGGIWHGNREGQTVKMDVFRFSGVRNLRTDNYTIYRASGMAFRLINPDGHINENYKIDQGVDLITAANSVSVNTDGVHYHGPAVRLRDRNGKWLNCGDDSYALNADDAWGAGTFTGRFDNVYGAISDVRLDNPTMNAVVFGIRMLSGGSRIDDVRIKNVTGSTTAYGLVLDNYLTPSQCVQAGPGNFGNIEIDGWHVTNAVHNPAFDWGAMSIHLNAKIEQFSIKNYTKSDFNNVIFPALRIGEKANIDQLDVGFRSRNYNGGSYLTEQIDIAPGAVITQANISIRTYSNAAVNGYPVRLQAGATISQLNLDGGGLNFTGTLNKLGTVTNLHDNSTMDSATSAASTWTLQDPSYWTEDTSNPSQLVFKGQHSGVVDGFKKNTSDPYNGNVTVSDTLTWSGTFANTGLHHALTCRSASTVPWSGHQSGYSIDVFMEGGGGIKLFKTVSGTDTTLAGPVTVPFAVGVGYKLALTAKNSTISVVVQRTSDGYYLTNAGTWQAAAVTLFSVTDTSIPAASGEWGGYAYNETNPNIVTTLANLAIAAAP